MEILSGLNSISVSRLKKTISVRIPMENKLKQLLILMYNEQGLDSKYQEQWNALNELMDTNGNYSSYREELKSRKGIVIPFLGVHLRDLVFIDEGNPDIIDNEIHIEKIELAATTFAELQCFQDQINSNYNTLVDSYLKDQLEGFIVTAPDGADDILYNLSTRLEPVGSV